MNIMLNLCEPGNIDGPIRLTMEWVVGHGTLFCGLVSESIVDWILGIRSTKEVY